MKPITGGGDPDAECPHCRRGSVLFDPSCQGCLARRFWAVVAIGGPTAVYVEALRKIKYEAASLADAQVIALEALAIRHRPAQSADDQTHE